MPTIPCSKAGHPASHIVGSLAARECARQKDGPQLTSEGYRPPVPTVRTRPAITREDIDRRAVERAALVSRLADVARGDDQDAEVTVTHERHGIIGGTLYSPPDPYNQEDLISRAIIEVRTDKPGSTGLVVVEADSYGGLSLEPKVGWGLNDEASQALHARLKQAPRTDLGDTVRELAEGDMDQYIYVDQLIAEDTRLQKLAGRVSQPHSPGSGERYEQRLGQLAESHGLEMDAVWRRFSDTGHKYAESYGSKGGSKGGMKGGR